MIFRTFGTTYDEACKVLKYFPGRLVPSPMLNTYAKFYQPSSYTTRDICKIAQVVKKAIFSKSRQIQKSISPEQRQLVFFYFATTLASCNPIRKCKKNRGSEILCPQKLMPFTDIHS